MEETLSIEEHNRQAYLAAFGTLHPNDRQAKDFAVSRMPELAPFKLKRRNGWCYLFSKLGEMSSGHDNFEAVVNSHLAYLEEQQKRKVKHG
jgi:hypothetical protein